MEYKALLSWLTSRISGSFCDAGVAPPNYKKGSILWRWREELKTINNSDCCEEWRHFISLNWVRLSPRLWTHQPGHVVSEQAWACLMVIIWMLVLALSSSSAAVRLRPACDSYSLLHTRLLTPPPPPPPSLPPSLLTNTSSRDHWRGSPVEIFSSEDNSSWTIIFFVGRWVLRTETGLIVETIVAESTHHKLWSDRKPSYHSPPPGYKGVKTSSSLIITENRALGSIHHPQSAKGLQEIWALTYNQTTHNFNFGEIGIKHTYIEGSIFPTCYSPTLLYM